MTDPTARDLIQRLADSVELLLLMRNGLTPLVITEAALDEARAYLAQPEPEVPTDEERFEHWWYHEGSAPPRAEDDSEEHTHRTSKIAWLNGAYCARYGNPAPAPPADGEVAELTGQLIEAANGAAAMGWDQHAQRILRAAELLQRQGPVPVSVSERLPGPGDCLPWPGEPDETHWCWAFIKGPLDDDSWERRPVTCLTTYKPVHSHWLPAHALPLPAATDCPRIDSWRPHATPRLHPLHGGDAPVPPAGPLRSIP